MAFDLEAGIALGLVAATFSFAFTYARSQSGAVRVVPASSGSVHPYEVRSLLDQGDEGAAAQEWRRKGRAGRVVRLPHLCRRWLPSWTC